MYWVPCGKKLTTLNAKFWRVPLNRFWRIFQQYVTK